MGNRRLKKRTILNIAFVLSVSAILLFLLNAPEETTSHLPMDDTHREFYTIASKKEAEKGCTSCHEENAIAPLPEGHPPKYRCLFCHKRN